MAKHPSSGGDARPPGSPSPRRAAGSASGADKFLPRTPHPSLKQLRDAADGCRGCLLYKAATQTVFGEGPRNATIMLVGEQPGDQEDRQGHPFVGAAGTLLRQALNTAGIDPADAYITNAVKHFKWTPSPRGKRRLHSKPNSAEITACRPWLEQELALVKPAVLVLLGATASQALLGSAFRVTAQRGRIITGTAWAPAVVATVHPSSILHAPDDDARKAQLASFTADLRTAAAALAAM